ncbi:MAG TPA: ATP-binding protein, partial [Anaerolineae bacterium]|nr:ATP-binding protein [Anaerolineae bacterium]
MSETNSLQHGNSHSVGSSLGQSLGWARGLGLSAGLAPSLSFGKSYMGEDHVAALVAQALGQQELILQTMSLEGGLLVDHYILTASPEGRQMAETLVPQAFHGTEEVATPVRTRRLAPETERYIRTRANLFTPSTRAERSPWALEPWADSSLLTMLQASSYVAPGVFEEGLAVTTQERVPPFAFRADMQGDVVLGHFISYETGNVTGAPLRLAREKMANWAFAADTGYGKTVAAERLVLETTRQWKVRTVVGDFGAGWRKLLSLLPGHSTLYGLYPGSPRPLRWNPLQIGRRITPEIQLAATCELLVNAGRMGQRQHGWLRQHLRALYQEHGVLVEDREVWDHDRWGMVSPDERELLDQAREERGANPLPNGQIPLSRMHPRERQILAVLRSMAVDLSMLYGSLQRQFQKLRPGSPDHTSMQGLLLRLEAFTQGEMARMYGRGEGCIAIEDLSLPWGITILEGGRLSDEYAKAVILGLITWHLYTDA